MEWQECFATGIDAIDKEYRIRLKLIGAVYDLTSADDHEFIVSLVLAELMKLVRRHFASEEALMAQTGFPGLQKHRSLHANFLDQLVTIYMLAEEKEAVQVLQDFLACWWPAHILYADMRYDRYAASLSSPISGDLP